MFLYFEDTGDTLTMQMKTDATSQWLCRGATIETDLDLSFEPEESGKYIEYVFERDESSSPCISVKEEIEHY